MRLIFLDIDGVLNGHDWDDGARSNRIRYQCIEQLNRIVEATGACVVISSAWRYMVHGGSMTLRGFQYLLRTHGTRGLLVLAVTPRDEDVAGRGNQISAALKKLRKSFSIESYVVLDDDEYDIRSKHPLVRCDGKQGLTAELADKAIEILCSSTRKKVRRSKSGTAKKSRR